MLKRCVLNLFTFCLFVCVLSLHRALGAFFGFLVDRHAQETRLAQYVLDD